MYEMETTKLCPYHVSSSRNMTPSIYKHVIQNEVFNIWNYAEWNT